MPDLAFPALSQRWRSSSISCQRVAMSIVLMLSHRAIRWSCLMIIAPDVDTPNEGRAAFSWRLGVTDSYVIQGHHLHSGIEDFWYICSWKCQLLTCFIATVYRKHSLGVLSVANRTTTNTIYTCNIIERLASTLYFVRVLYQVPGAVHHTCACLMRVPLLVQYTILLVASFSVSISVKPY